MKLRHYPWAHWSEPFWAFVLRLTPHWTGPLWHVAFSLWDDAARCGCWREARGHRWSA